MPSIIPNSLCLGYACAIFSGMILGKDMHPASHHSFDISACFYFSRLKAVQL